MLQSIPSPEFLPDVDLELLYLDGRPVRVLSLRSEIVWLCATDLEEIADKLEEKAPQSPLCLVLGGGSNA